MTRVRFWPMVLVAVLAAAPVGAQPASADADLVKRLLERIDALERRVAELESRQPAPAPGAPPAAVPAHTEHPELAAPAPRLEYPLLNVRGFSDVTFSSRDPRGADDGFRLGQFILHFSSALSPRVSFIGETSFTAQSTGFNLEVERAVIKYSYNDHLKVSFGRYHTPIGYWNTAYHHGLWLQTTVSRPELVQFGGRLQPVHFVGLLVEGAIPSGPIGLGYGGGVGNGRGLNIARAGDAGDVNGHRAWVANVQSRPPDVPGLQIGASVYGDTVTTGGPEVSERIASAHLAWTHERPELIAEFSNVRHALRDRPGVSSHAFYIQSAYRLQQLNEVLKPYYRFERIDTPEADPILDTRDLFSHTIGLRYDISHYAALKGEFRRARDRRGRPWANAFLAQTSFVF